MCVCVYGGSKTKTPNKKNECCVVSFASSVEKRIEERVGKEGSEKQRRSTCGCACGCGYVGVIVKESKANPERRNRKEHV